MRTIAENKTRTGKDQCHRCGRPIGNAVEQCRMVNMGFYCWRDGLVFDGKALILPTPDPVGEPEQAVIDEYAPKIAEVEKRVDELLLTYTTVEQSYRAAVLAGAAIGVGPVYGQVPTRAATERERKRAKEQIDQLTKAKEATGERMQKARIKLNALHAQFDHRRRVARQPVIQEEEI